METLTFQIGGASFRLTIEQLSGAPVSLFGSLGAGLPLPPQAQSHEKWASQLLSGQAGSGSGIVGGVHYPVSIMDEDGNHLESTPTPKTAPAPAPAPVYTTPAPAPVSAPAPAVAPAPAAAPVQASGNTVDAPMPGNILDVPCKAGDHVKAGDVLVVLEAMKMENEILAPHDGVITQVYVSKGANVDTGAPLVGL